MKKWVGIFILVGVLAMVAGIAWVRRGVAVPELMRICGENISPTSRSGAVWALMRIGRPAREAVPMLAGMLATNGFAQRDGAALALMRIQGHAELTVPVFIKCLGDSNMMVRLIALHGLGGFGREASNAVPAMLGLTNDPNGPVQANVAAEVWRIDADAAARAGLAAPTNGSWPSWGVLEIEGYRKGEGR